MRKAYSYIRMSSDKQLRGDSLRRQLDMSNEYAREHNFTLVDNIDGIPLKDIGVSGFRGVNATKGVLSIFLNALEEGKIESGSALLIESLDRLSRDDVTNAFSQFLRIISFGIEIVTLADKQSYTHEKINSNQSQLFISLGVMIRANDESQMKSIRLGAAWANKRSNASIKPITRLSPAWLKYSEQSNNFELIHERAEIVRTIFDMCINTCGLRSIVRYLNLNKVPTFGKAKFWYKSYLTKIIFNRAVIGEFQPHKLIAGNRIPEGEPIQNYFPKVVSESVFYQAHAAVSKRTVNKGRNGNTFSNIFSHLVVCGSCGSKIFVRNRGKLPKGGKTLICSNKFHDGGCKMSDWKLPTFESQVFKHLRELDFSELLGSDSKAIAAQKMLTSISAQINEKSNQLSNTLNLLVTAKTLPEANKKLNEMLVKLDGELKQLNDSKTNIELELEILNSQAQALKTAELKKLLVLLEEKNDDYFFRSSVNQSLSRVIDKIVLIADDQIYAPWELEESDDLVVEFRKANPKHSATELDKLVRMNEFKNYNLLFGKHIRIHYKTGAVRHILVGDDYTYYGGTKMPLR